MKVGIIGTGFVGSTAAYAMALEGTAQEIVLVDLDEKMARAQAEDILHATPHAHPIRIFAGDYRSLSGASAVILACGVNQQEGETRMELLERNAEVFKEVIPHIVAAAPEAILVAASNPVDVITHLCAKISGLPQERVIGSGTILDTARFRSLLGQHLGVSPHSVHGYVLGEHGDSEVLAWSSTHIGSVGLVDFSKQIGREISADIRKNIDDAVRHAAGRIIAGKGATYFGIGAGLSRIIRAIGDDEGAVITVSGVSSREEKEASVSFSVPRIIGVNGIRAELSPSLSDSERQALEESIAVIRAAVDRLGYL
ncbi:MAG: L-lactate dehydrogenase [Desulfofustis sp.]|jgi:L-lactate dehydrogenase